MATLPSKVTIVDVGPRDGLQNESNVIDKATKIELIHRLADAGLSKIEAGSFVNPSRVPQMAGSEEIFRTLSESETMGITYTALTPNLKGLQRALSVGVSEVAVFAAASETFSLRNINCSISESLQRFEDVCATALKQGVAVRGYISCALGCPFENEVDYHRVNEISLALLEMGCFEVCLTDAIGVATPKRVEELLSIVTTSISTDKLALHFHNTYGQALANTYAGLQAGISTFDTSIAGLGGCPFAPGATGNVSTEDMVYMLNDLGIEHGIDIDKLVATGSWISAQLGKAYASNAGNALLSKLKRSE